MPDPLLGFAIALFIGALVGIEREKRQAGGPERGIGGLRTFILFAMAGAVAAWLAVKQQTPWIFIGGGMMVTAVVLAGYVLHALGNPGAYGLTTEAAAIVVYLLGGTVLFGYAQVAVALAIATTALLAFKEPLHGIVDKIGRDDLYAGLQLLIASFIILPVLPNETITPWAKLPWLGLNPYKLWLLVVLISGLSLVGYIATRLWGAQRGVSLTGLFGGMVSSTAVSLAFARRSREEPETPGLAAALASGLLLAWAIMAVRVVVLVAAVHPALVPKVLLPMTPLAVLGAGLALLYYWQSTRAVPGPAGAAASSSVPLRNPFSLWPAIKFAVLFAAVLLLVRLMQGRVSERGVYLVATVAGLTDVDAITLSMAQQARQGVLDTQRVAVIAITLGALANTVVKCGLVVALGAPGLRSRAVVATVVSVVGAGAALLLV